MAGEVAVLPDALLKMRRGVGANLRTATVREVATEGSIFVEDGWT